jgi:hypothetical protein
LRHVAARSFWAAFETLPEAVQKTATKNFELLKRDPRHPLLHFKRIGELWSVRAGAGYRALATEAGADIVWFWIGSHADYDLLIKRG